MKVINRITNRGQVATRVTSQRLKLISFIYFVKSVVIL